MPEAGVHACRAAANGNVKWIDRAACRPVLCADVAAMRFDDRARDRKPQAHAGGLGGDERLEDARQQLRGNAGAGIGHRDLGFLAIDAPASNHQLSLHLGLIVHGLHRVERKVHDDLLDFDAVSADLRRARCRART